MPASSRDVDVKAPPRPRGRPRRDEIDDLILDATLRQLTAVGFARMSIEAVATDAGVGRPAVYRRWRGKAELAMAALAHLRVREPDRLTGDTRRDLVLHLARMRRHYEELRGMALVGALLVEEERHPELLGLFRDGVVQPRRVALAEILAAGKESGELRADLDVDAAVTLLVGSFYARYVGGEPFGRSWAERMVDAVWPALVVVPG